VDHEEDVTGEVEEIHKELVTGADNFDSDHTVDILQHHIFVKNKHQVQQKQPEMSGTL
jgi:hypothetical protein